MLQNKLHVCCCPFCCTFRKKLFQKWWTCIGEEEEWSWGNDEVGAYAPKIFAPLHVKKNAKQVLFELPQDFPDLFWEWKACQEFFDLLFLLPDKIGA